MTANNQISRYVYPILAALLLLCTLTGCGQKENSSFDCPFIELNWDSTIEDMTAAEGDGYSTYDSLYGGLCYTYPKEYEGCSGTVKYMFDGENRLMSVAWAYSAETAEELDALYKKINTSTIEKYGESGYDAGGVGNYGGVWYREKGDIILTTMSTAENKALQYAYLHPLVSHKEEKSIQ